MANHTVDCEVCGEDLRKSGISHAGCVDKDAIRKGLTYTVDAGLEWKVQAQNAKAEIARLTDDLATSRAETAMAFEVAAQRCEFRDHAESEAESEFDRGYDQACDECAAIVRTLAPADATAAIAARDKAKDDRISELENALAARGEELTAAWHQIAAVTSGDDQ